MQHDRRKTLPSLGQWLVILALVVGVLLAAGPGRATPMAPAETELLQNGGFEDNTAWEFGNTSTPAIYTTEAAHSGSRSVRTGSATSGRSYSSIYQIASIPANASSITLRFWYKPYSEEINLNPGKVLTAEEFQPALSAEDQARVGASQVQLLPGNDVQMVWLLDTSLNPIHNIMYTLENTGQWTEYTYDLNAIAYRGETVYVYFDTYNDGDSLQSWMYVDDVSFLVDGEPITVTPSATTTPGPLVCQQIVLNPSFEEDIAWLFGNTPRAASYTTEDRHDGQRSVRTGITPSMSVAYSYSSVRQAVTIPADASSATLTFWYKPHTTDIQYTTLAADAPERMPIAAELRVLPDGRVVDQEPEVGAASVWSDAQQALILDQNLKLLDEIFYQNVNTAEWTYHSHDLSQFAGQTIYLYFNTINDGDSARSWMYVDDVTIHTCFSSYLPLLMRESPFTPTPTATPSPTPTGTLTATPTPTNTPTPTPTQGPMSIDISGPTSVAANEVVTYTITYTNVPATGGVEYTIPDGFTISETVPAGNPTDGQIFWPAGGLSGTGTITVSGSHSNDACPEANHVAAFYDNYGTGDPLPSDSVTTALTTCINIDGPDLAVAGEVVTYTIAFAGLPGGADVEYEIPTGFTVSSSNLAPSSQTGNVMTWTAADLGGTTLITLTGSHDNTACPAATHTAGFSDASASDSVVTSLFCVDIEGPTTAAVSEVVTYTITYGDIPTSGGVTYTSPTGFTVTGTEPSATPSGNTYSWPAASLTAGNVITVTGSHDNTACPEASHLAELFDIYTAILPTDTLTTTLTGC